MALERSSTTPARSLTVLLPVHDAQSSLAETVTEVLEVASELSDRLEVLIIDDASADATIEVAHELMRHYPQVRAIRHSIPLGHDQALRTGLAQSQGDVVIVRPGNPPKFERLHRASKPARPNYLMSRARRFARGE